MSQHTDTREIYDSMDQIIIEAIWLILGDSTMLSISLDLKLFQILQDTQSGQIFWSYSFSSHCLAWIPEIDS